MGLDIIPCNDPRTPHTICQPFGNLESRPRLGRELLDKGLVGEPLILFHLNHAREDKAGLQGGGNVHLRYEEDWLLLLLHGTKGEVQEFLWEASILHLTTVKGNGDKVEPIPVCGIDFNFLPRRAESHPLQFRLVDVSLGCWDETEFQAVYPFGGQRDLGGSLFREIGWLEKEHILIDYWEFEF